MNAEPIVVQEIPQKSRTDTRRSWRAMRGVVAWSCFGVAGIIGFLATYSQSVDNSDPPTRIKEFESSLNYYKSATEYAGYSKMPDMNLDDFDPVSEGDTRVGVTTDFDVKWDQLMRAGKQLSAVNRIRANEEIRRAVADYNTRHASSRDPESLAFAAVNSFDWKIRNTPIIVAKSLGVAAVSAFTAGTIAWLLVMCLALAWWFLTDRLRDLARAVRGE